jgi:hypothetical protein
MFLLLPFISLLNIIEINGPLSTSKAGVRAFHRCSLLTISIFNKAATSRFAFVSSFYLLGFKDAFIKIRNRFDLFMIISLDLSHRWSPEQSTVIFLVLIRVHP